MKENALKTMIPSVSFYIPLSSTVLCPSLSPFEPLYLLLHLIVFLCPFTASLCPFIHSPIPPLRYPFSHPFLFLHFIINIDVFISVCTYPYVFCKQICLYVSLLLPVLHRYFNVFDFYCYKTIDIYFGCKFFVYRKEKGRF